MKLRSLLAALCLLACSACCGAGDGGLRLRARAPEGRQQSLIARSSGDGNGDDGGGSSRSAAMRSPQLPTFYHTTADLDRRVRELAAASGGRAVVESIGTNGTAGVMTLVTVRGRRGRRERRGRRGDIVAGSSDRNGDGGNRAAAVLLVFGEHARELITAETALTLLDMLVGHSANSTGGDGGGGDGSGSTSSTNDGKAAGVAATRQQQSNGDAADAAVGVGVGSMVSNGAVVAELARKLLGTGADIHVVPNVNPRGRRAVEAGAFCRRSNEDGVDLNRNWGAFRFARSLARCCFSRSRSPRSFPSLVPFARSLRSLVPLALINIFAPRRFVFRVVFIVS